MTYSTAKKLLSVNIDSLSLEELQKYKVKITVFLFRLRQNQQADTRQKINFYLKT